MLARLSGAALAIACALAPALSHGAPHPAEIRPAVVTLAMMSATDVLRAIRCAIPKACTDVPPLKSIRKRNRRQGENP